MRRIYRICFAGLVAVGVSSCATKLESDLAAAESERRVLEHLETSLEKKEINHLRDNTGKKIKPAIHFWDGLVSKKPPKAVTIRTGNRKGGSVVRIECHQIGLFGGKSRRRNIEEKWRVRLVPVVGAGR